MQAVAARISGGALALCLVVAWPVSAQEQVEERAAMVSTIVAGVEEIGGGGVPKRLQPAVLAAMGRVPRHDFVPDDIKALAYQDRPLPIGYGQTISQPLIVALMTDLLRPAPGQRTLEVGTGSGYQAAVLAELGLEVYSIEIVPELARRAGEALREAGYEDVETRTGDGYFGWPEAAPFDSIVVTAAASHVPPPLIEQLKPGGRMVIPVGPPFMVQQLMVVEKAQDGSVSNEILLPVAFVPLTGGPR
jgi:protein-L-isoaspartate(D-aspartate) O-methyltransferase